MLELSVELLSRSSFMCVVIHVGSTCALLGHGWLGKDCVRCWLDSLVLQTDERTSGIIVLSLQVRLYEDSFCCVSLGGNVDIFSLGGFKQHHCLGELVAMIGCSKAIDFLGKAQSSGCRLVGETILGPSAGLSATEYQSLQEQSRRRVVAQWGRYDTPALFLLGLSLRRADEAMDT